MEAIDIARRLAGLGSAEEAQNAYKLALHQGLDPAGELEAAAYILQSGGDYQISYTHFCRLYNQGCFQEQILPVMIGAFYEPNAQELRSRYQRNCKLLKKYPYLFRRDFLPFDELPVWFFPYDGDGYVPFYPDQKRFGDYINFKNPVVSRNFFRDLENPILADDVYSQYELEYLHDNVRRSEDVGRENHLYLHYADWAVFCAHLQCLDFHRLLKDEKIVFLIGGEIERYPIDFKAEYGVDYSRCPLKPVGIREVSRLIWHTQLSYHNGGDFFNEVFDAHPNLLVLPSILMEAIEKDVADYENRINSAQSLRHAQELFAEWQNPRRIEELYRLKGRTAKDIMAAVYLENSTATAGLDRASRIAPAVFVQPHFTKMPAGLGVNTEKGCAVLNMPSYEEIKNSPLFTGFPYIKTFSPMRRFTTSHGASVRFMYQSALQAERKERENPTAPKTIVNDAISERIFNRSFMADPEDRLFKDSVVVRFEDGKLNPKATFTALAAFLDLPYTQSMTECTEGGKEVYVPGNAKGFDPETVYRTYDEFVNDDERYFIEYFLRDAYEYYGYDFHYYDGAPVDEERAKELIHGFTTLDGYIRETWSKVFALVEATIGDQTLEWKGKSPRDEMLENYMKACEENRLKNTRILLNGLRFVSKTGQPLRMIRKLEPDPALLEQPLYH
ncbi:hypothetical protein [uncultured Oscillibacter sp.]|uniref:hypothetical protein n=1 Tax=uncultured Oscillibacter sp. TaxID=876091 RepID=UPI0025E90963|nr:hypothetical protein [uncultured Oscillibacter sp.]MCX4371470.1 hypothetical protein [Dysosmobacter sp.]